MAKTFFTLLGMNLFGVGAFAGDNYTVDSCHTFPSFEVNHLGFSTQRGRFNEANGKIVLDAGAGKGLIDQYCVDQYRHGRAGRAFARKEFFRQRPISAYDL